jgi:hypothetical protein
MEPESSSPCSQEPATCPYPEPNKSNPRPQTLSPLSTTIKAIFYENGKYQHVNSAKYFGMTMVTNKSFVIYLTTLSVAQTI